jgi:toxin ParE1/3/4
VTARQFLILPAAERDVRTAILYYRVEVGVSLASRFASAFAQSLRQIRQHPDRGSSRFADELGIDGMRHIKVARFPFLIFYLARSEVIEVWRVLHNRQDIPTTLDA